MSDDSKLIEVADRGHRAEKVLAEIGVILDDLDKEVIDLWRDSEIHDAEGQAKCLLTTRVIQDLRDELERRVHDGNYARQQIAAEREDNGT